MGSSVTPIRYVKKGIYLGEYVRFGLCRYPGVIDCPEKPHTVRCIKWWGKGYGIREKDPSLVLGERVETLRVLTEG